MTLFASRLRIPALMSLLALAPATLAEPERGFFAGASITHMPNEFLVNAPANEEEVVLRGIEIGGGYKYNGWLGIDLRYGAALGEDSLGTTNEGAPDKITYDIDDYQGIYYRPEITNREAKLYFLLGYAQVNTTVEASFEGTTDPETTVSEDFSGMSYGMGAGWFIDDHFNINVELRRLLDEDEEEFNILSIGADYRF